MNKNVTGSFQAGLSRINLGRVMVPIVVLLAWTVGSLILGSQVLPGPSRTLAVIVNGLTEGWLLAHLLSTLTAISLAYLIGVTSGVIVGLILGGDEILNEIFEIYILSSYAVPKIIFFPIFLLIFGVTLEMKVAYGAISGFFPMVIIITSAVRNVDTTYLKVADSLQLSHLKKFRHVIFPSILVQLVIALRLAFSFTFIGVVLVELIASKSGLGLVLQNTMEVFNMNHMMAVVAIIVSIAVVVNLGFYAAQRGLERQWNITTEASEEI